MLGAARLLSIDTAAAALGFAGLILSVSALTWTIVSTRRSTSTSETQNLRREIDELRAEQIQTHRELEECKQGRVDLMKQNFDLMMEVHQLSKREPR